MRDVMQGASKIHYNLMPKIIKLIVSFNEIVRDLRLISGKSLKIVPSIKVCEQVMLFLLFFFLQIKCLQEKL